MRRKRRPSSNKDDFKKRNSKNRKFDKDRDNVDSNTNNDSSWYTVNHQLTSDAGTYSFNNAIGARIRNISVLPTSDEAYVDKSIAGIMTLRLLPSIGKSSDPYTPINVAARAIYDKVNYKNSRNFSYEAPDLMMYLCAVASAYSYHAYLSRIYGVLNTFSQTNRYIPDALVRAMGASPSNLRMQMADFRYYINYFARKVNTFCVPVGISFFEQAYWMYSNVYMDADSIKAQLYVYAPFAFWKYNETGTEYGGSLVPTVISSNSWTTGATLQDLVDFGNNILEPLFSSQDINNISTDVMKAFENAVITLPDIGSDFAVVPVYNPEVLTQIHNAYPVGGISLLQGRGSVTQSPTDGTLRYELVTSNVRAKLRAHCDILIDLPMDNPTPEDVAVATRLHPIWNEDGTLESSNTFIPYDMVFWRFEGDVLGNWDIVSTTATSEINSLGVLQYSTKFNDAPLIYYSSFTSTPESVTNFQSESIIGDLYNYTTIDRQDMSTLDEACILSLFTQKK